MLLCRVVGTFNANVEIFLHDIIVIYSLDHFFPLKGIMLLFLLKRC